MSGWEDRYRKIRTAIPTPARNLGELFLWKDSYLRSTGWTRSRREAAAVDARGEPIPWYTYPAITFLADRIGADSRVFEFGMGNSTLWWSRRAGRVVTCEGDPSWYERIAATMPANVEAILVPEASDDYVRAAERHGEVHDIVIIDGRRRVECCRHSLSCLSAAGIVIWDDFHRDRYRSGREMLGAAGFRELPFWGMTPITAREACTSIFYRAGNCLGI